MAEDKEKKFVFKVSIENTLKSLNESGIENVKSKLPTEMNSPDNVVIINTRILGEKVDEKNENFQVGIFYKFEEKNPSLKGVYSSKKDIPNDFLIAQFVEMFRNYFTKFSGSVAAKGITDKSLVFNRIPTNKYNNAKQIKSIIKDFQFTEMDDSDKQKDDKANDESGNYKITLGYIVGYQLKNKEN